MGVEHLLDPLFLFNPSCSSSSRSLLRGGDLEGGGSSGGWLQGEGGGAAKGGEKGGWRPRKGKNRGATTRVLWEKETTPQMSLDFASNGPQLFPHIHAPKINLWQHFLGYYKDARHPFDLMWTVEIRPYRTPSLIEILAVRLGSGA
jgi:hypothetical protein